MSHYSHILRHRAISTLTSVALPIEEVSLPRIRLKHRNPERNGAKHSNTACPNLEIFANAVLKSLTVVTKNSIHAAGLRSCSSAKAELLPSVDHWQQKYQNNRPENSHLPTRLRKWVMRRFKSSGQAQRFLAVFDAITSHFRLGRHLWSAEVYREMMKRSLAIWEEVVVGALAAV